MLMLVCRPSLENTALSGHIPLIIPLFRWRFPMTSIIIPGRNPASHHAWVTVAMFSLSRNARLIRSSMLDVLALDYVRTGARQRFAGMARITQHAFRNALIPFVTILGWNSVFC